jgi:hypothetical protein
MTGQADEQTQQTQLLHEYFSQGHKRQCNAGQPKFRERLLLFGYRLKKAEPETAADTAAA